MASNDQLVLFVDWVKKHKYHNSLFVNDLGIYAREYKERRMEHASTSPGPVNCWIRQTYQGIIREGRQCPRCGGDDDQGCPFFTPGGVSR